MTTQKTTKRSGTSARKTATKKAATKKKYVIAILMIECDVHHTLSRGAGETGTAQTSGPAGTYDMQTCWVPVMPIDRAAPRARSSEMPRVNGPRSLTVTVTD